MNSGTYQVIFDASIPLDDVQDTLQLAIIAAEALHGQPQVRLEAEHRMDVAARSCVIHATSPAGRDLLQIFVGYLSEEFGQNSYSVRRIEAPKADAPQGARR
ncbi:MAG: hypothetical protein HS116_00360 [Planctomycetes bacterium]|nr:hypothetical protein [Planctomycetota bacterium]